MEDIIEAIIGDEIVDETDQFVDHQHTVRHSKEIYCMWQSTGPHSVRFTITLFRN